MIAIHLLPIVAAIEASVQLVLTPSSRQSGRYQTLIFDALSCQEKFLQSRHSFRNLQKCHRLQLRRWPRQRFHRRRYRQHLLALPVNKIKNKFLRLLNTRVFFPIPSQYTDVPHRCLNMLEVKI